MTNINAPGVMVGEKAADMILGKPPASSVLPSGAPGVAGEAAVKLQG